MPNSAYKVIDVIGSSETSWEDAAQRAIAVASESIHNLRVAEVVKLDPENRGRQGRRLSHPPESLVQDRALAGISRTASKGAAAGGSSIVDAGVCEARRSV